ncbi:MAG: 4-hydroxy-3-methylbut-2-enyl diphosphate reductase [Bacilli bacterium]|nr:4-hydroxy-3-methylbut-2-enyl diphosphate reductase [Bacilli bacterium]
MRTYIVEPIGVCKGVENAINQALNARKDFPNIPITILGPLVHNEHFTSLLEKNNIKTLQTKDPFKDILLVKEGILIFAAHGHHPSLDEIAKKQNLKIIDATCPMVHQTHLHIYKAIHDHHEIIYIGKKGHIECDTVLSFSDNIHLYQPDFNYDSLYDKSPLVINQTTLNYNELLSIHNEIKSHLPNANIINEVCNVTRIRQEGIINIPNACDLIYIVGSTISSNVNRLYEIAMSSHPRAHVIMVNNVDDVKEDDLLSSSYVAIASGASTPCEIVEQIIKKIEAYVK